MAGSAQVGFILSATIALATPAELTRLDGSGISVEFAEAEVARHITGRGLADLARELVFEPLEMGRSAFLWAAADADVIRGNHETAVDLLKRGLRLARGNEELETRLSWRLDRARAISSPYEVPTHRLEGYAGQYGPRQISLRGGALFYLRGGVENASERRLIPLSENTFVFAGLDWFRLRFETDDTGRGIKAVGLYLDGRSDETPRTR